MFTNFELGIGCATGAAILATVSIVWFIRVWRGRATAEQSAISAAAESREAHEALTTISAERDALLKDNAGLNEIIRGLRDANIAGAAAIAEKTLQSDELQVRFQHLLNERNELGAVVDKHKETMAKMGAYQVKLQHEWDAQFAKIVEERDHAIEAQDIAKAEAAHIKIPKPTNCPCCNYPECGHEHDGKSSATKVKNVLKRKKATAAKKPAGKETKK